MQNPLPKLVTFDGEARSGKGTVVGQVKDYLRDECNRKVMLIDAGQVFRVLVVAMKRYDVDFESPELLDVYLGDPLRVDECVRFVKSVYHMTKAERNELLYTHEVGALSAKVGARPLSQVFKDNLLRKWLRDARNEGFDTVLLDGRALEETGEMLAGERLCDYVLGLYFICDPAVSAQRTLGHMPRPYDELEASLRREVDTLVSQIEARNKSDRERSVQPVVPPADATTYSITDIPCELPSRNPRPMAIIDRSVEVPMDSMALPIAKLIVRYLS